MSGWKGWRDFDPSKRNVPAAPASPRDRGSMRGARRCVVDELFNLYDHSVAKASGIKGIFFQSRKEALRYIALSTLMKAGHIRPRGAEKIGAWRQVRFPLHARRPDGLMVKVCDLVVDFVYEQHFADKGWLLVVEDVKPTGGHREDAYLLKRKWFEAEYGLTITET